MWNLLGSLFHSTSSPRAHMPTSIELFVVSSIEKIAARMFFRCVQDKTYIHTNRTETIHAHKEHKDHRFYNY